MKMAPTLLKIASAVALAVQPGSAGSASPIAKVLELVGDLEAKIIAEGEAQHKAFEDETQWCEDRARTLQHEIKDGQAQVAELSAAIGREVAVSSELTTKVERFAGELAQDDADVKAARHIRNHEGESFKAEESELVDTVEALRRAIGILERNMRDGGSFVQLKGTEHTLDVLRLLVEASSISTGDASKISALLQGVGQDGGFVQPEAAAYESKSGGIVEVLEDLYDKANDQLDKARKTEVQNRQAFEMMEQSLTDEIKNGNKDAAAAKAGLSGSQERKAGAQGDLGVTQKELGSDTTALSELHHSCMARAGDFESETKSRGAELKALADAKKALTDNVGGADSLSYEVSFVQTQSSAGRPAALRAAHVIRELGRQHGWGAMSQLAARISSVASMSQGTGGPFDKVKSLITNMVTKLEDEAAQDSTHKSFCDKELSESNAKQDDKSNDHEKLSTQIDKMSARSAQLKEEVAALQKGLGDLSSSQATMDQMRANEKDLHVKNKAEMEQGLKGVKLALKVLGEYYAKQDKGHTAADGSSSSIIGMLEVVESDFTQGLAEMTASEDNAQTTYDQDTKENQIERSTKDQDVKYKSKESSQLDQNVAEVTSDRESIRAELDAVGDYLKNIEAQCIAKAESYGDRKARFEAELAGLKEALRVLESETALVQRSSRRLRGGSSRRPLGALFPAA